MLRCGFLNLSGALACSRVLVGLAPYVVFSQVRTPDRQAHFSTSACFLDSDIFPTPWPSNPSYSSTDRLAGQLRADAVDGEQGLLTDAEERQEEF